MSEFPLQFSDLHEAALATIGPDCRPQLSEVWVARQNGVIHLSFNSTRQKTKHPVRQPACTP
jgi:hypothetical protein